MLNDDDENADVDPGPHSPAQRISEARNRGDKPSPSRGTWDGVENLAKLSPINRLSAFRAQRRGGQ